MADDSGSNLVEAIGRLANPVHPERTLEQLVDLAADLRQHSYPRSEPKPSIKLPQLTPGDKANLVAAYRAGATSTELAAKYGISKATVLNLLTEHGVPKRRRPPSPKILERAAHLYVEEGLAMAAIAAKLRIPQSTLRRHLHKQGVKLRPRGGFKPRMG